MKCADCGDPFVLAPKSRAQCCTPGCARRRHLKLQRHARNHDKINSLMERVVGIISPMHLEGLHGTWCGERYDGATAVLDPDRCTCIECLSAADDYGERCKRAYKKLAHALFRAQRTL